MSSQFWILERIVDLHVTVVQAPESLCEPQARGQAPLGRNGPALSPNGVNFFGPGCQRRPTRNTQGDVATRAASRNGSRVERNVSSVRNGRPYAAQVWRSVWRMGDRRAQIRSAVRQTRNPWQGCVHPLRARKSRDETSTTTLRSAARDMLVSTFRCRGLLSARQPRRVHNTDGARWLQTLSPPVCDDGFRQGSLVPPDASTDHGHRSRVR